MTTPITPQFKTRLHPGLARLAFAGAMGLCGAAAMAQSQAPAAGVVAAPAPAAAAPLAALHWLAGCWRSEVDEAGSGEQWMPAAGGTMLGMSRTLKGGRTVQFEFMQIRASAAGAVVFIAQPGGRPGSSFMGIEISETAAVFENLGHEFPQRVIYRLQPRGQLAARIEGLRGGELRGVDFPMRRSACDSPAAAPTTSGGASQGG